MGNHMSKKPTNNLHYTSDHLNSYEAACRLDVDLQSFDTTLQTRTADVINSLAAGVEVRALSFESLKQTTECLLELNQEVVKNAENADVANATLAFSGATLLNGKMEDLIRTRSRLTLEVILDCKKDIWKNQDLFDLVEEYFDNSLKTLDFCAALEKCLKRARDSQLLIKVVLQQFDDEEKNSGDEKYSKTLAELKNFKDAGDPFTDEFFQVFQSVYLHQIQMLEKLQLKKNKLDRKLRYIRSWRRVSSIIFAATFAAVLICSVVAAAIAAPPLAAALSAAASIPLGSMGKWIDSLLVSCEAAVRGQKEIVSCMNVGTYVAIKDLDNIRVLIRRLEVDIEAIVENAGFANSDSAGAHVKIVVDEIKKNLEVFMENTEELGVQADNCSRDIRRARTVILQRIIKHPQHFN